MVTKYYLNLTNNDIKEAIVNYLTNKGYVFTDADGYTGTADPKNFIKLCWDDDEEEVDVHALVVCDKKKTSQEYHDGYYGEDY